jgi:6-phosphogluconate dehydrogenase
MNNYSNNVKKMFNKLREVFAMEVGLVGLGKMGYPLALNMLDNGHKVFALSRSPFRAGQFNSEGISGTSSAAEFVARFDDRRIIWLMVPAGEVVDRMIDSFIPLLSPGDIIIDGGNSHYRESIRRAEKLKEHDLAYADLGISGGPSGARHGACMMIGSTKDVYKHLEPLLKSLCHDNGLLRVGENGSGHYVKMIHNGIEYGMMQAIAEGFELMDRGPYELDLSAVASLWNNGSVIRSWLIELTARMLAEDPHLDLIKGVAGSSGTGSWTVDEALQRKVPLPVITQALYARYSSEQENSFAARVVAGLRREFGGHEVVEA